MSLYHLDSGELEVIGQNEPGQYTQASVYDAGRRLLYMFNYRAYKFGVFDVEKREMRHNVYIESIPHISALDDSGRCWATYERSQRWCCFDPEKDDYVWFDKAMETATKAAGIMYAGAGPIDGMINGGDGYLYVGTGAGESPRRRTASPAWQSVTTAPSTESEATTAKRISSATTGLQARLKCSARWRRRTAPNASVRMTSTYMTEGCS